MTSTVRKITTVMAILCTMSFGPALAAGNGSMPRGKPFVEINGQIAEVKLDISTLEAQHDAIFARVEALEDAGFQAQIDFLTSEIARLDAENLDRIAEIEDIVAAAALTDIDVAFALSELVRLETELSATDAAQTLLIDGLQSQIDTLRADIAANASGLLGAIADGQANAALIALLEIDIVQLETDVANLEAELAGKQDDIIAACPPGQFVINVLDDGTLICGEDQVSAGATLTVATVFPPFVNLDNKQTVVLHLHCVFTAGDFPCPFPFVFVDEIHVSTFTGDKFVSAFCPAGFRMTGGGFDTNSQDVIVVEDSRPSSTFGNGWTVFFDNRGPVNTSGISGRATVRCVKIN